MWVSKIMYGCLVQYHTHAYTDGMYVCMYVATAKTSLNFLFNLLSSSLMVIVAVPEVLVITLLGNVLLLILTINSSLLSNILSLLIEIFNNTVVTPVEKAILYGPEL